MSLRFSSCLTLAAVLFLEGCAATRPIHYYTVEPAPQATNQTVPSGITLLVGDIPTPEAMQDGRIRYRIGSNETAAYEYHRWGERPGLMVRNSLIRALRNTGKYERVVEATSSGTGDYLVRGKLNEFDEVDGASIQTRISLQIELVDRKTNRSIWDRVIEREEPVNSKTVPEVVQSLDRNLQHVLADAVVQIDQLLASRR